jgi:predicted CopG family antitoxin
MSCKNCLCNECQKSRISEIEKKFDIEFETFTIFLFDEKRHLKDYDKIINISEIAIDRIDFIAKLCNTISFDFTQLLYNNSLKYSPCPEQSFDMFFVHLSEQNKATCLDAMKDDIYYQLRDSKENHTSFENIICKYYNISHELLMKLIEIYDKIQFNIDCISIKK